MSVKGPADLLGKGKSSAFLLRPTPLRFRRNPAVTIDGVTADDINVRYYQKSCGFGIENHAGVLSSTARHGTFEKAAQDDDLRSCKELR